MGQGKQVDFHLRVVGSCWKVLRRCVRVYQDGWRPRGEEESEKGGQKWGDPLGGVMN
jgi:hypothetical protein